ncbi:Hsp90-like protein [Hamiltosporidium magnivora]|uniref:Hsp90-like protein n=1 Tax=Hamiltosporidium magnivora TaxID=148818 RepID=A0A4Q9L076_9MICR|nr:Hsp90-like protein [Hamiltosporidium magnivora]
MNPQKNTNTFLKHLKTTFITLIYLHLSIQTQHEFTLDTNLFENISSLLLQNQNSFIKELISNSIDANKKLVSETGIGDADINKHILITLNKKENIFSIRDRGIGMSYEELTNYVGKVGASGTRANKKEDSDFIGQFGVGLYSTLSVADGVEIVSRRYNSDQGYKFTFQKGSTKYTLDPVTSPIGTTVTVKISPKHQDKITQDTVTKWVKENLLRDPSSARFKVQMKVIDKEGKVVIRETDTSKQTEEKGEKGENEKIESTKEEIESTNESTKEDKEDKEENDKEDSDGVYDLEMTPWSYSKDLEELKIIFKKCFDSSSSTLLNAFNVKFSISQTNSEDVIVPVNFEALVFMPEISDMRMFGMENKGAVRVYVSGSMVHDPRLKSVPELLSPMYIILRSRDAQLTSSREEFLCSENTIKSIYSNLQTKVVDTIKNMSGKVLESYNTHIKSGLLNAKKENNEKLVNKLAIILPFETVDGLVTLGKFNEGVTGDKIYYTSIPISDYKMRGGLKHPLFDGIEIPFFFLNGLNDEQVIQAVVKFDNKELCDIVSYGVEKTKVKYDKEGKEDEKEEKSSGIDFIDFARKVLKSDCSSVVVSQRLKECPFCVKMESRRMSAGMKSVLGVNTIQKSVFRQMFEVKPIFEVNMEHEEVKRLDELSRVDEDRAGVLLKSYFLGTSVLCGVDVYDKVGSYLGLVNNGRVGLGLEMVKDEGMVETGAKITVGEDKDQKGYGFKEEEDEMDREDKDKDNEIEEEDREEEYKEDKEYKEDSMDREEEYKEEIEEGDEDSISKEVIQEDKKEDKKEEVKDVPKAVVEEELKEEL